MFAKKGTYTIMKWSANESAHATSTYGLLVGGVVSSDWFSLSALSALNISMVTRMDSDMVDGRGSWNMVQSMPANRVRSDAQSWKLMSCCHVMCGPLVDARYHQMKPPTVPMPTY